MSVTDELQASVEAHNERALRYRAARDSSREIVADARRQEMPFVQLRTQALEDLLTMLESYEDGITWMTTCTHCASLWDKSYAQHEELDALKKRTMGLVKAMRQHVEGAHDFGGALVSALVDYAFSGDSESERKDDDA